MVVFRHPGSRQAAIAGDRSAAVRKVLEAWISRDAPVNVLHQNLWLATQLNLKEGVEAAAHALRQPNQPTNVKLIALALIAKVGDRKELPDVESCRNDSVVCAVIMANNQTQVQTQVRDIALAVEIKLRGQDPKAFGFDRLDASGFPYETPGLFGFRTDADRETAAKKWGDWVAAHSAPADAKSQVNKP